MSHATLVFVYGTLKRGGSNHSFLAGQNFIGEARTTPGFQLHGLAGYPGMVASTAPSATGVTGEVWSVEAKTLARLDELEGLKEGLYRRDRIALLPPFADTPVETYFYARSVAGAPLLGDTWHE